MARNPLLLVIAVAALLPACTSVQVSGRSLYSSVATDWSEPNPSAESTEDEVTLSRVGPVRTQSPDAVSRAIRVRDIVIGMSMTDVKDSWGRPSEVETAGRKDSGHQKWVYHTGLSAPWSLGGSRIVFFESGKVVGWQTY